MVEALLLVLGAALALLIHEGAHALVALANGQDVTAFRPYPHRYAGRLYVGRCWVWPYDPDDIGFHVAPAVASFVLAAGWLAVGLWPLAIGLAVDHIWWWLGWFRIRFTSDGKRSDGWKVRQALR